MFLLFIFYFLFVILFLFVPRFIDFSLNEHICFVVRMKLLSMMTPHINEFSVVSLLSQGLINIVLLFYATYSL